jgi:hypothetical protein
MDFKKFRRLGWSVEMPRLCTGMLDLKIRIKINR